MLRLSNVTIAYETAAVANNVSMEIRPAETVGLVGANGAGKSTVAKAIVGLLKPVEGAIDVIAQDSTRSLLGKQTWAIARSGIVYIPETQSVFEKLTVYDNLIVTFGALRVRKPIRDALLNQLNDDFPLLARRADQKAGTLSGGQRKLLAIARSLLFMKAVETLSAEKEIVRFKLLILDEPTRGLDPSAVSNVEELLGRLNADGLAVLIIEQMVPFALGLSNRGYLMRQGKIIAAGPSVELLNNPDLTSLYLGASPGPVI